MKIDPTTYTIIKLISGVSIFCEFISEDTNSYSVKYPLIFGIQSNGEQASLMFNAYNPFSDNSTYHLNKNLIESVSVLSKHIKENVAIIEHYKSQRKSIYDIVELQLQLH